MCGAAFIGLNNLRKAALSPTSSALSESGTGKDDCNSEGETDDFHAAVPLATKRLTVHFVPIADARPGRRCR